MVEFSTPFLWIFLFVLLMLPVLSFLLKKHESITVLLSFGFFSYLFFFFADLNPDEGFGSIFFMSVFFYVTVFFSGLGLIAFVLDFFVHKKEAK